MNRFILDSFSIPYFRKFKTDNKTVKVGKKITIISGQNGIGKSSLMSALSSCSGTQNTRLSGVTSNSKMRFEPEFLDYFKINDAEEYNQYRFFVNFKLKEDNGETFSFTKRISFSNNNHSKRGIRLIPRDAKLNDDTSLNDSEKIIKEKTNIGASARVTIPTIYVSLSRLLPVGETNLKNHDLPERKLSKKVSNKLLNLYIQWYNDVLPDSIDSATNQISSMSKESTKKSRLYANLRLGNAETQSVGQDNVGSIISALIDFQCLKLTDEKNYHGGILYIDELDDSLHPDAQLRLLRLLKRISSNLSLQIIATSHSLIMINQIIKYSKRSSDDYKLIYYRNLNSPHVDKNFDNDFDKIKADLYDKSQLLQPKLNIYCEDDSTKIVFESLLNAAKLCNDNNIEGIEHIKFNSDRIDIHPLYLGNNNIQNINEETPLFQHSLIILDGDFKFGTKSNLFQKNNKNFNNQKIKLYEEKHNKFQKQYKNYYDAYENTEANKHMHKIQNHNIVGLPDIVFPELFLHRILKEITINDEKYSEFWNHIDDVNEYSIFDTSKAINQFDLHLSGNDLKEEIHKTQKANLLNLSKKTNMLYYYFKNNDNKYILNGWIKGLNKKANDLFDEIKSKMI